MVYRAVLPTLRRDIDKLFEDTFGAARSDSWTPAVDVKEDSDSLTFELDLPGVPRDNVDITCDNGVLTITGEKQTGRKENNASHHIVERAQGTFHRSFQLPANLDETKTEASYGDGVLTVRVPKAARPVPKKIQVR